MSQLFGLGRTVATPGALDLMARSGVDPASLLGRHAAGEWGTLDAHDVAANNQATRIGVRILSNYRLCGMDGREDCGRDMCSHRVWVITEGDRSVTTFLLPEDY